MLHDIRITIDGVDYLDFKSFSLTYGLDMLARDCTASFSDRWLNTSILDLPFEEGADCKVTIDGELMLDGFLDDIPMSEDDDTGISIGVSIVSHVAHLEDSSAIHESGTWTDTDMASIAADIVGPHGVSVEFTNGTLKGEPFERFAIEEGESINDALLRMTKLRDIFLTSDAGRTIVFTKAGTTSTASTLRYGENIKFVQRTGRYRERFSAYLLKSQTSGRTNWYADQAARNTARVVDAKVAHTARVLIVIPDHQCDSAKLEHRGNWERNTRAGKSRRWTYGVVGFTNKEKRCWRANELIHVYDPRRGVDADLLIAMVHLNYDETTGSVATLELANKEAYDPLSDPPKAKKKKKARGSLTDW